MATEKITQAEFLERRAQFLTAVAASAVPEILPAVDPADALAVGAPEPASAVACLPAPKSPVRGHRVQITEVRRPVPGPTFEPPAEAFPVDNLEPIFGLNKDLQLTVQNPG